VREAVELALVDLESFQMNLALAREQLVSAQAEYDQMFELYRAQEATTLDLASAETALAEARRAVVTGTLDLDLARLAVWHAAGSLEDALMPEASK
jgi:outer membrane protein TolC